jgi:hypothetical protein
VYSVDGNWDGAYDDRRDEKSWVFIISVTFPIDGVKEDDEKTKRRERTWACHRLRRASFLTVHMNQDPNDANYVFEGVD